MEVFSGLRSPFFPRGYRILLELLLYPVEGLLLHLVADPFPVGPQGVVHVFLEIDPREIQSFEVLYFKPHAIGVAIKRPRIGNTMIGPELPPALHLDDPGENGIEAAIQLHSGNTDTKDLGVAFGSGIAAKYELKLCP